MTAANNNNPVRREFVQLLIRLSKAKPKIRGIHHLVDVRGNYTLCGLKLSRFASGKTRAESTNKVATPSTVDEPLCKHCQRIERRDSAE